MGQLWDILSEKWKEQIRAQYHTNGIRNKRNLCPQAHISMGPLEECSWQRAQASFKTGTGSQGWRNSFHHPLITLTEHLPLSPALQMGKLRHRLKNKIQENTVVTPRLVAGIIGPWNFQSQWAGSSCLAPWLDEPDSNQARKPQFTYRSCASASGLLAHAQWCFLQQTHECCKHKQTSSVARSKATKDGVAPGLMHTKIQCTSKQSTTGHKPKGAHRGPVRARAVHTEARHAPGQRGTGLFPPWPNASGQHFSTYFTLCPLWNQLQHKSLRLC